MTGKQKECALIIGGGIGGLTTAIALRRIGWDIIVLEQTHEFREAGAGLALWSNATAALEQLGCGVAIQSIGVPITSLDFYSSNGNPLSHHPLAKIAQELGTPSLAIHRADLQTALLEQLGKGIVRLQAQCIGFSQNDEEVSVRLADGQNIRGTFLIGADGLHSNTRKHLFNNVPLRYAGYTLIQGVTQFEDPFFSDGKLFQTWGRGIQFGATKLTRGRVYWFFKFHTSSNSPRLSKRDILSFCLNWHQPIEAIITATDETSLLQHDIYDIKPLRRWGEGRVTLLGDAAHPMTTHQSQGACQAIEDALMLSFCFQQEADPVKALKTYEARRIQRATAIVNLSRNVGWLTRWKHPTVSILRDSLLKAMPTSIQEKNLQRVLGYRINM